MKRTVLALMVGVLLGAALLPGTFAEAAEVFLSAYPSTHTFYLDGKQIQLEAYVINGNNYVKLADVGKALEFNVYWDSDSRTVQIMSGYPYTGQPVETGDDPVDTLEAVCQEIIRKVNQVRQENGASVLAVDDRLMAAAQERAETLYTYHRSREDCEAVLAHGYPYGFGSNITAFTGTATSDIAQRAVANWCKSSGHFRTMIDPGCDTIGVGVAQDGAKTVCYLFLGNPKTHNPYE